MSENRKEITPYEYIQHFFKRDALLISMGKNGKVNPMTLAWKTIGELWSLPIIVIAVAPNRYSFTLLTEGVQEFTINIPSDKISGALDVCGSLTGRDTDKLVEANLETIKGKRTKVPTLKECVLNYECKIVHTCKSGNMAAHTLFFGQILTAYASNDIVI